MSDEFVDTNILIYAHDGGAGEKQVRSVALITRLAEEETGALSIQVLTEFYWAATRKLGMAGKEAEDIIADLRLWTFICPGTPMSCVPPSCSAATSLPGGMR
jgi:predicted nucleic acid-binding protein